MQQVRGFVVAAALLCLGGTGALKLPSYIPACARNDPNLNACMKRNAEAAIPELVKGDRKYRVPPLDPFFVNQLVLEEDSGSGSAGFSLILTNTTITGLSRVVVEDIRGDLEKMTLELELVFPYLELHTSYKLSGKFQRFPIKGDGPGNITLTDVKVDCKFHFDTQKKDDGLTYLIAETPQLKFEIRGRLYLHLDNLLNGDKTIGDNMNVVLNDNWRDVAKNLGPGVAEVLGALLKQTISGMFELVPFEEIFV